MSITSAKVDAAITRLAIAITNAHDIIDVARDLLRWQPDRRRRQFFADSTRLRIAFCTIQSSFRFEVPK